MKSAFYFLIQCVVFFALFISCQNKDTSTHSQNEKEQQSKDKPNILFIFTDQQNWNTLSTSGNPYVKTPNMDWLAEQGVMFSNSYCTSPVCGPSRSSLVTGCMPHETGRNINDLTSFPHPDLPQMGQVFRDAGYDTKWAGKWHIPESYPIRKHDGQTFHQAGFDFLPFYDLDKPEPEWAYGIDTDGPCTDAAIKYIKSEHQKPFLLGVSLHNPHDICFAVNKWDEFGKFVSNVPEEKLPPLPENFEIPENEPDVMKVARQKSIYGGDIFAARNFDEMRWRNYMYNYYRLVEKVDVQVGRIIESLKESNLLDNTLIIFTSDHGDGNASHKWVQKLALYEESTAVPFIISYPGNIPKGKTISKQIVSGIDIFPTMCDYAGIDIPERITGSSIKTIIDNPNANWRKFAVTELQPFKTFCDIKGRSIRTLKYKYNLYSNGEKYQELYDMENDPGEMNDLSDAPKYKEVVAEHRKMLEQWMKETNDDFRQLSTYHFDMLKIMQKLERAY